MNKTAPLILSLLLILLVSGCTQAGRIINESAELPNETGAMQVTPENETEQNISTAPTEPQNITQPEACPETCNDGNNCTYGYCSEDTGYECVHAIRICLDSVRPCPDGVKVSCKNMCINNSCTSCEPDCSEHQLPVCGLTQDDCGECEILDTETCKCARITACVPNDNCCPEGCNYTGDNDCEVPECNESWECGNWSECMNGTQSRTCTDLNSCGTEELKPNETQECQEPEEFNITITFVEPQEEWVKIENTGNVFADMTNWTINDTLSSLKKRFTFPEFILQPENFVFILKGYGDDNTTHLYRNKDNYVWNNDGDTAVLIDNNGTIISIYSYDF